MLLLIIEILLFQGSKLLQALELGNAACRGTSFFGEHGVTGRGHASPLPSFCYRWNLLNSQFWPPTPWSPSTLQARYFSRAQSPRLSAQAAQFRVDQAERAVHQDMPTQVSWAGAGTPGRQG